MEDFRNFVWLVKYVRVDSQPGRELKKRLQKAGQRPGAAASASTDEANQVDDGEGSEKAKKPPKLLGSPNIESDKVFFVYEIVQRSKLIGPSPAPHCQSPKLKALKAAKEINDNYGVAFLDKPLDGEKRFVLIPRHKVWVRLHKDLYLDGTMKSLVARNSGRLPCIIRKGDLIEVDEEGKRKRYRIFGFGERPGRGIFMNYAAPDETKRGKAEFTPEQLVGANLRKLRLRLTGAAMSP
jgi:hypothetical protein